MNTVYFVQGEGGGLIKIGWTGNLKVRFRNLQCGIGEKLRLLADVPGGAEVEEYLHNNFEHLRVSGEWFRPGADLVDLIEKIKAHGAACLPTGLIASGTTRRELPFMQNDFREKISAEMKALVIEAAEPMRAGESVKSIIRRAHQRLGRPKYWRVEAAWKGEAGEWSAAALEEFRARLRDLRAQREITE